MSSAPAANAGAPVDHRPIAVTIVAYVYIAVGIIGFSYHLTDFRTQSPFQYDVLGIELIRFVAIVAGVYVLRGNNWARLTALAWMVLHVIIGALNSLPQFAVHLAFAALIALALFHPAANRWFADRR